MLVQGLSFLQVDDLAKVEDCLDHVEVKFAEDRVVVVQAQVTHVHLNFFPVKWNVAPELFANLKKAFFDLPLDTRLELLLHVVKFQILALEILERV